MEVIKTTILYRFISKYKIVENGCWQWQAGLTKDKYGAFKVNGATIGAHRLSYILYIGEIPDSMYICHKCDNPSCVNPFHLFLGTPNDNIQDMITKGRNYGGNGAINKHPSQVAYTRHKCRCRECKALMAKYAREYRKVGRKRKYKNDKLFTEANKNKGQE